MIYKFIIQEKRGDCWFDYYDCGNDRSIAVQFLIVFRNKDRSKFYRLVRLIQ